MVTFKNAEAVDTEITNLTNQFYSTIPHDYGRSVKMNTKILDTMTKVEEKVTLIDSLIEINKAVNRQDNQAKKVENNKLQKLEPN